MSGLQKTVVVVVVVLALIAVADFALYRGNSRLGSAIETVRETAVDQYARLTGQPVGREAPP